MKVKPARKCPEGDPPLWSRQPSGVIAGVIISSDARFRSAKPPHASLWLVVHLGNRRMCLVASHIYRRTERRVAETRSRPTQLAPNTDTSCTPGSVGPYGRSGPLGSPKSRRLTTRRRFPKSAHRRRAGRRCQARTIAVAAKPVRFAEEFRSCARWIRSLCLAWILVRAAGHAPHPRRPAYAQPCGESRRTHQDRVRHRRRAV